jgi:glutaredoxin-like YruB-family protein
VRTSLKIVVLIAAAFGVLYELGDSASRSQRERDEAPWAVGGANPDPKPGAAAAAEPPRGKAKAAAEAKVVYYQYVDDRGSVNIVDTLDEVPPAWRERAGRVEVDVTRFARTTAGTGSARFSREPAAFAYTPDPTVVVYTTSWCGYCRKTLAWLDAKGVQYENRDVESDAAYRDELIRKTGKTSIPVVEIDGTLIRGYNPKKMDRLLAAAG